MKRKILWPSGEEATLTKKQVESIHMLASRFDVSGQELTVSPLIGEVAIMFHVGNMWFGIEEDGYAHT